MAGVSNIRPPFDFGFSTGGFDTDEQSDEREGKTMRSLTVRRMSRGVFALIASLAVVLAAAGLSIARSGLMEDRGAALCTNVTSAAGFRGFDPPLPSCKQGARRGVAERLRVGSRLRHGHRHHPAPGVTSPPGTTPGSPTSPTRPDTANPVTPSTPADATPPHTQITAGPTSSTTGTTASLTFNSSESGSTFTCKLDDGGWTSCASPKSYTALAIGDHTFSVRATDAAGNTDAT